MSRLSSFERHHPYARVPTALTPINRSGHANQPNHTNHTSHTSQPPRGKASVPLHDFEAQLYNANPTSRAAYGGYVVIQDTLTFNFVVDERGQLTPSYKEYFTACNSYMAQTRYIEVYMWQWKWTGTPGAPELENATRDISNVLHHALNQYGRTQKLALDARFLDGMPFPMLEELKHIAPPRLAMLATRNIDIVSSRASIRYLFDCIGRDWWRTNLIINGRSNRFGGPENAYILGLHRHFIGLTSLRLQEVSVWDWHYLVRDLTSLHDVVITSMLDSQDCPVLSEYIGLNNLETINLSIDPANVEDYKTRKVLMRALKPLRTPHLKKLTLANDYLWSRKSIDALLSEHNCRLEEFTANNFSGLTPQVLVDMLCLDSVGRSLKKLHINPGKDAGYQLLAPVRGGFFSYFANLQNLPRLEEFSVPMYHIPFLRNRRQQMGELSAFMKALTARCDQMRLRRITISTADPSPTATISYFSTEDYNALMAINAQPGKNVYFTSHELGHGADVRPEA